MLTYRQIKTMAKPYTNRQMLGKGKRLVRGSGWWSNGFIAIFEDAPEKYAESCKVSDANPDLNAYMHEWGAMSGIGVYPVEIRHWGDDFQDKRNTTRKALVRLSDSSTNVYVNAKLLGALLKRNKDATLLYNESRHSIIARCPVTDKCVGVLMLVRMSDKDYQKYDSWSLKNEDIPPTAVKLW